MNDIKQFKSILKQGISRNTDVLLGCEFLEKLLNIINDYENTKNQLQQKENIIKEIREDLYKVVKWCTENKHNENTIKRYLVVDYGTIVGKINEIRTKLDKEVIKSELI